MSLVGITRMGIIRTGIIRTGITRMLDQQGRYRQWPASCGHQARRPVTVLPLTPPSSSGVWANHSPSPHPTNLGIRRVGLSQCHPSPHHLAAIMGTTQPRVYELVVGNQAAYSSSQNE